MSIYANPALGGVRFRGTNIAPRARDMRDGEPWYEIWHDWATGDRSDPWKTWIRPSIDAAHEQGANMVRFISDPKIRVGPRRRTITRDQLRATYDQLLQYLAAKKMFLYADFAEAARVDAMSISDDAELAEYFHDCAGIVSAHPNCALIDIAQEIRRDQPEGRTRRQVSEWVRVVKEGLTRPVPVTCSIFTLYPPSWSDFSWILPSGVDYVDCHPYFFYNPHDFYGVLCNEGKGPHGTMDVPVLIGETGLEYNGTFHSPGPPNERSEALRQDFYNRMGAIANLVRLQGVCHWALAARWDESDFGMYQDVQDSNLAFTSPRPEITTAFKKISLQTVPYRAEEDAHAVIETAPTVESTATDSVTLTWFAAVGPSDEKPNYTAQIVKVDQNGFPLGPWQKGYPSGQTTASFSGLDPDSSYAARICVDDLTYSPWASFLTPAGPPARAYYVRGTAVRTA